MTRSGHKKGGEAFGGHVLNTMSQLEQTVPTDSEFLREMQRCDAPAEAAQDHDGPRGRESYRVQRRARVQVEDLAAGATAIVHDRLAVAVVRRLPLLQRVTLRTVKAIGVRHAWQQSLAGVVVQHIVDGEQHRCRPRIRQNGVRRDSRRPGGNMSQTPNGSRGSNPRRNVQPHHMRGERSGRKIP
jgi:hypothetical protein